MKTQDVIVVGAFGVFVWFVWQRRTAAYSAVPIVTPQELPSTRLPMSPIFTGPSFPAPVPDVQSEILYQNPATGQWEPIAYAGGSSTFNERISTQGPFDGGAMVGGNMAYAASTGQCTIRCIKAPCPCGPKETVNPDGSRTIVYEDGRTVVYPSAITGGYQLFGV